MIASLSFDALGAAEVMSPSRGLSPAQRMEALLKAGALLSPTRASAVLEQAAQKNFLDGLLSGVHTSSFSILDRATVVSGGRLSLGRQREALLKATPADMQEVALDRYSSGVCSASFAVLESMIPPERGFGRDRRSSPTLSIVGSGRSPHAGFRPDPSDFVTNAPQKYSRNLSLGN